MAIINSSTLEVRKDNWGDTRIQEDAIEDTLAENEVLFRVDRAALTANNITYASTGDVLGYWGFFPTEEGWGRIPAMGWAEVIASAHDDIAVGERVWGWFPYSTHLKVVAGNVSAASFSDVSGHRASYAPVYSSFDRANANPIYEASREDQDSLLRGLFMTSWLVEDFITINENFGAEACLVTSASSKTSIALGFCLKKRGDLKSIGITSAGNVSFCESLGCYDAVYSYDDLQSLDASQPVVLVDMAGSANVISELHHHYGDNMKHSCRIGATHYDEGGSVDGLPGAKPEFFFAPAHVQSRSEEIGAKQLMIGMGTAFTGFRVFSDDWLRVVRNNGPDAALSTYQSVLTGRADPSSGQIISMWPDS